MQCVESATQYTSKLRINDRNIARSEAAVAGNKATATGSERRVPGSDENLRSRDVTYDESLQDACTSEPISRLPMCMINQK